MRLSEHFSHESDPNLVCPCGCGYGLEPGDVSPELVDVLEHVRARCGGKPVKINRGGGCRCARYNREIRRCEKRYLGSRQHGDFHGVKCPDCGDIGVQRSSRNSQHLRGTAADITVRGVDPDVVQEIAEEIHAVGGIGRYNTFTHLDVRGHRAVWDRRS